MEHLQGKPDEEGMAGTDVALVFAILAAVQAFSSYSLFELMLLVGVPQGLAWVLPVSTDAVVILATKVWLNTRYGSGVRNFAMGLAIGAFVISVACAGIQHTNLAGLRDVAAGIKPANLLSPEWLRFTVGAIPTAAAGFVVHLVAIMRSEVAERRQNAEAERAEQARKAEEKTRRDAERAVKPAPPKPAVERPAVKAEPEQAVAATETPSSNLRELPAPGTPRKKDQGICWVVGELERGVAESDIRPVDIDKATGSNGYFKKHMDDVMAEARRRYIETGQAVGE